ncbi:asparagine synthase, partial [Pseudoxanthomonas sp. SGD-10]
QSTPYKEVTELENGNYLKIDVRDLKKKQVKWFNIENYYLTKNELPYHRTLEKLDELLQLSVRRRLDSSDLDVGTFLSGGIDSGLVTAIAAKHQPAIKTFTVRMQGGYDESALAQQVADKFKTQHTVVDISFDNLESDIENILLNYGEPFCDNSAIPSYYVAKAAKEHVTVVLNGDGADELFGGYRRHVPFRYFDFFNTGAVTKNIAQLLTGILPVAHEKMSTYNYVYRLLKFSGYSNILQLYNSATANVFVGYENKFLVQPDTSHISEDLQYISSLKTSSLKKLLLMDFQTILFNMLLPKMDIATMAHSLEGRSPFLSKELLEFAPGLRDSCKVKGITTKFILRDLAKKYLPPDLINQPKRGFEIPLKKWIDHQLRDIIHDYLLSSDALYPQLINKIFIQNILTKKENVSDERRAKILLSVFSLEVWYKNYQNRTSARLKSTISQASSIEI